MRCPGSGNGGLKKHRPPGGRRALAARGMKNFEKFGVGGRGPACLAT